MKKTSGNGECSEGKAGGRRVYVLKVYYIPALKSPSVSLCNNRKDLKIDFKKLGHFKKKHQVKQSSTTLLFPSLSSYSPNRNNEGIFA